MSSMDDLILYLFLPFFVTLLLAIPVVYSLGLACAVFLLFSGTRIPPLTIATEMYAAINVVALLALPMFVLTGELLNRCRLTDKLILLSRQLVGWIRGGLAHVNIVTSMFFAGISGSVLADAASIGPLLIPAMIKEGYSRAFSAAITASSSTIGAIIPPSIPLIIVGGQLQISIGGLFLAGVLPGILTGLFLMIVSYLICRWNGYGLRHRFEGVRATAAHTVRAGPVLIIPVWILGGILGGVFTPTEAGAIAVVYTIVISTFFYRTLNFAEFFGAIDATVRVTASALVIVAIAIVFGRILTFHQFPQQLVDIILNFTDNKIILFVALVVLFLFVGTFMDALANMIILGPLLMPLALQGLDIHPIQYGMFLMYALLLGIITPPLGLVLFVVSPIAGVSLERTSLAVLPLLFVQLLVLALIVFVPEVTLALPRMAGLL